MGGVDQEKTICENRTSLMNIAMKVAMSHLHFFVLMCTCVCVDVCFCCNIFCTITLSLSLSCQSPGHNAGRGNYCSQPIGGSSGAWTWTNDVTSSSFWQMWSCSIWPLNPFSPKLQISYKNHNLAFILFICRE